MNSSNGDYIAVDLSQRLVNPITGEVIQEGNYSDEALTIRSEMCAMDPRSIRSQDNEQLAFRELTREELRDLAKELDPDKYPYAIPALRKLLDEKRDGFEASGS